VALNRLGASTALDANLPVAPRRPAWVSRGETFANATLILLAMIFVAGPIAATIAAGLQADLVRLAGDPAVRQASVTSLLLALVSAVLAVLASLAFVSARQAAALRRGKAKRIGFLEWAFGTGVGFVLVIPPIVIGAGWFVLLRHSGMLFAAAPVMVASVNAVM